MAIMAVGCLIFQLFPQQLLMFFNASEEMLSIGSVALRIISVSFVLAGFDIIAGSVCQAIGNPLYSLITSVCRQLVVLLPVAWLLSHTGVLTLVWLAFPHLRTGVPGTERYLPAPDHAGRCRADRQPGGLTPEKSSGGTAKAVPPLLRQLLRNASGSTASPSFATEKCRWAPWAASAAAVVPTAPMVCPADTVSPVSTAGSTWRLA